MWGGRRSRDALSLLSQRDPLPQAIGDTALDALAGHRARLTRAFISAGSNYLALMRTDTNPSTPPKSTDESVRRYYASSRPAPPWSPCS